MAIEYTPQDSSPPVTAIDYEPQNTSGLVSDPAEGGSFSASNEAELAGAQSFAAKAKEAQNAAEQSETNAATSEANAATSASNAVTSASNAATSESNAATSEANAATSEANAATSEANAATSEANAATSASNAASSEANALASATAAQNLEITSASFDTTDGTLTLTKANSGTVTTDLDGRYAELTGADFTGDVTITNGELTVNGSAEAELFKGDIEGAVHFKGAEASGATLTKGDVVYISGHSGQKTLVDLADASDSSKMPAFGIVAADPVGGNVDVVTFGTLKTIDTSSYTDGDELFVATTAGGLTATAPSGEGNLVQKIAKVVKAHNSGNIKVMGAGRTNATPNLNDGNIFIGDSNNLATTASFTTEVANATSGKADLSGATFTGDVSVNDLLIYHDNIGNSVIEDTTNYGFVCKTSGDYFAVTTDNDEIMLQATPSLGVFLRHNNQTKLATNLEGVSVSGRVSANLFRGDLEGAVHFKAITDGDTLTKGDVVYLSDHTNLYPKVRLANASDSSKMPALGIVEEDPDGVNVTVVTSGILNGINTSSYTEGDELYVDTTSGGLTATPPTGESSALQKIAKVNRVHATSGSIKIMGAGRTNATPNLNDGNIFIGDSNNQAVTASLATQVSTLETSHADVLVDGDFTSNGLMKRDGVGLYSVDSSTYATETYVDTAVSNLVDSAPATLDTLNELASALGDDANFSTTVSNSIGTKWTEDATKINNWDTAYSWGNHGDANYLTASDITGKANLSGATFTGNISFGDSNKINLGADNDLQIYHDGSHSYIDEQGTGDLILKGLSHIEMQRADTGVAMFRARPNRLELFADGNQVIKVEDGDVDITGDLTTTGTTTADGGFSTSTGHFATTTGNITSSYGSITVGGLVSAPNLNIHTTGSVTTNISTGNATLTDYTKVLNLGTGYTIGTTTINMGGVHPNTTNTINIGQNSNSTVNLSGTLDADNLDISKSGSVTTNIATGTVSTPGNTKTLNLGTGFSNQGTTNVNIGSPVGTTNIAGNVTIDGTVNSDLDLNGNDITDSGHISATQLTVGANGISSTGGVTASGSTIYGGTLQSAGNTIVGGNVVVTGTVDGRDVATDGARLDTIPYHRVRDDRLSSFNQQLALTTSNQNLGQYQTLYHPSTPVETMRFVDVEWSTLWSYVSSSNNDIRLSLYLTVPSTVSAVSIGTATAFTSSSYYSVRQSNEQWYYISGDYTHLFTEFCRISQSSSGGIKQQVLAVQYNPASDRTYFCATNTTVPIATGDTVYFHPYAWQGSGSSLLVYKDIAERYRSGFERHNVAFKLPYTDDTLTYKLNIKELASTDSAVVKDAQIRITSTGI